MKILLAEDESTTAYALKKLLECDGHEVILVEDGISLMNTVDHTFDVILTDIQLPGINGISASKIIRHYLFSSIPIIGITGMSECDFILENESFDEVFFKPIIVKELFQSLRRAQCKDMHS